MSEVIDAVEVSEEKKTLWDLIQIWSLNSYDPIYEPLVQEILRNIYRSVMPLDVWYSPSIYTPSLYVINKAIYLDPNSTHVSHVDANVRKWEKNYRKKVFEWLQNTRGWNLVQNKMWNDKAADIMNELHSIFWTKEDPIKSLQQSLCTELKNIIATEREEWGLDLVNISHIKWAKNALLQAFGTWDTISIRRKSIIRAIHTFLWNDAYEKHVDSSKEYVYELNEYTRKHMNRVVYEIFSFVQKRKMVDLQRIWNLYSGTKIADTYGAMMDQAKAWKIQDEDIYSLVYMLLDVNTANQQLDKETQSAYLNDKSFLMNLLLAGIQATKNYDRDVAEALHTTLFVENKSKDENIYTKHRVKDIWSAGIKLLISKDNTDTINDLVWWMATINVEDLGEEDTPAKRRDMMSTAITDYLGRIDSLEKKIIVRGEECTFRIKNITFANKMDKARFDDNHPKSHFLETIKNEITDDNLRDKISARVRKTKAGSDVDKYIGQLDSREYPYIEHEEEEQWIDYVSKLIKQLDRSIETGSYGVYEDAKVQIELEIIDSKGDSFPKSYFVEQIFQYSDNQNQVTHDSILDPTKMIDATAKVASGTWNDEAAQRFFDGFDRMIADIQKNANDSNLPDWYRESYIRGMKELIIWKGENILSINIPECISDQSKMLEAKKKIALFMFNDKYYSGQWNYGIYEDQFDSLNISRDKVWTCCKVDFVSPQNIDIKNGKPTMKMKFDIHNGKLWPQAANGLFPNKKHLLMYIDGDNYLVPWFMANACMRWLYSRRELQKQVLSKTA